ncbi:peroxide-responsive transcriptional repressor PerR [Campylobacter troglodytis]|uniref:peroxide-responsive transcriptional repressor PerR n=1 Tax=Campylobacter troglodytis TaxID=654363 RepID=UPI0011575132|nr:peroxide-responsive transcriptional repressor PerR [Campylobacter troglodytis]TQR60864.1 transcriptional repressor [Campylobacter troglodytis]
MELINLLKEHELKATPQRLCVLEILKKHEHPNIDELYEQVRARYPSISLATVYKNLNVLAQRGLVVEVNVPNQKSCYDIYEEPHIHIVCSKCGYMEDLSFKDADLTRYQEKLEKNIGALIDRLAVAAYIDGCSKCR